LLEQRGVERLNERRLFCGSASKLSNVETSQVICWSSEYMEYTPTMSVKEEHSIEMSNNELRIQLYDNNSNNTAYQPFKSYRLLYVPPGLTLKNSAW
jgi:hypothetical protein